MSQGTKKRIKTAIIGLDGAGFPLIGPWIREGKLPTLRKIMDEGSYGDLISTIPPLSPVAWTSMMSGVNPAKHGIFDFVEPDWSNRYKARLTHGKHLRTKVLWHFLNDNGYKVGVINVPMTYPPDRLDSFMISGMDTPGPDCLYTFPPSLKDEINREVGEYIIEIPHSPELVAKCDSYVTSLMKMIDNRLLSARYLLRRFDLDFFMLVFVASDRAQHNLWKFIDPTHPAYREEDAKKYGNKLLMVYQKLDKALEELLREFDDDTNLFIVSDHGADTIHKSVILNNWLAEKGYLKFREDGNIPGESMFALKRLLNKRFRKAVKKGLKPLLRRVMPLKQGQPNVQMFDRAWSNVMWDQTKAFYLGAWGKVFINLKGREPFGIVEPGQEYENVRDSLIRDLMKLTDTETGEQVVKQAIKREEIYSGDYLEWAPDILILWNTKYNSITLKDELISGIKVRADRSFFEYNRRLSADHTLNGILIAKGPHIVKNHEIGSAQIVDICPTILHTMGVPVPAHLDGHVLESIFQQEYLMHNPVQYQKISVEKSETQTATDDAYSESEKEDIAERLKGLGYLE